MRPQRMTPEELERELLLLGDYAPGPTRAIRAHLAALDAEKQAMAQALLSVLTVTDDPSAWTKDGGVRSGRMAIVQQQAERALREAGVLPGGES